MRRRQGVESEVAITNSLGIRDNLYAGPLTQEAMFNVFPFENTINVMFLSGSEMQEMFDFIADRSASDRGCGAQAQVSGVRFTMDCAQTQLNLLRTTCDPTGDASDCAHRRPHRRARPWQCIADDTSVDRRPLLGPHGHQHHHQRQPAGEDQRDLPRRGQRLHRPRRLRLPGAQAQHHAHRDGHSVCATRSSATCRTSAAATRCWPRCADANGNLLGSQGPALRRSATRTPSRQVDRRRPGDHVLQGRHRTFRDELYARLVALAAATTSSARTRSPVRAAASSTRRSP